LEPWPPVYRTDSRVIRTELFGTIPDVDFLPLVRDRWDDWIPETRRRLAAAEYVTRECAKKRARAQVIREAEKLYGPFSVKLADWLRRKSRR
jgi:hypothetical protein